MFRANAVSKLDASDFFYFEFVVKCEATIQGSLKVFHLEFLRLEKTSFILLRGRNNPFASCDEYGLNPYYLLSKCQFQIFNLRDDVLRFDWSVCNRQHVLFLVRPSVWLYYIVGEEKI